MKGKEKNKIKQSFDTTVFTEKKFTAVQKHAVYQKLHQPRKIYILPTIVSGLLFTIIVSVVVYFAWDGQNSHVAIEVNQTAQRLETNTLELFTLNDIEERAYTSFKEDYDVTTLRGLEPMSIAKLYVYASYYQEYDVQYALYTDRTDYVLWSAEEDRDIPSSDRETQEQIITKFRNLDKGTFIQTSEHEGYIEFYRTGDSSNSEEMAGFSMVKNEDGIWQVAFMPLQ